MTPGNQTEVGIITRKSKVFNNTVNYKDTDQAISILNFFPALLRGLNQSRINAVLQI